MRRRVPPRYRSLKKQIIERYLPFLARNKVLQVDAKGVPITHYDPPVGDKQVPVDVCWGAFRWWESCTRFPATWEIDPTARRYFLNCAEWLHETGIRRGEMLVWEYDFDTKNVKAPWISGMAQGHAIQVFTRAYLLTEDERHAEAARQALQAFFVDLSDGGVRLIDKDLPDAWWYCEYPAPENQHKVLNGMMFALLGLHELYTYTKNEQALAAFGRGVRAVLGHVHEYDAGHWSYYDVRGQFATTAYHDIHVSLFWRLYHITEEETFRQYAEKWSAYRPSLTRTFNPYVWLRVASALLREFAIFFWTCRDHRAGDHRRG